MATLFLSVPAMEEGFKAAEKAFSLNDTYNDQAQQIRLMTQLNNMLDFAKGNLESMLAIMGVKDISDLNNRLQIYKDTKFSLRQIFPAFSEPMLTEALARAGIGNSDITDADYGLLISAFEDSLRRRFPEYFDDQFARPEVENEIRQRLSDSGVQNDIAGDIIAQLFTGTSTDLGDGFIDFGTGRTDFSNIMNKFMTAANKVVRARGATTTNAKTYMTVYEKILIPYFQHLVDSKFQIFANEEGYKILEDELKEINSDSYSRDIIKERIKRGGITTSTKIKTSTKANDEIISIITYFDQLNVNIDKKIFDIKNRPIVKGKKQSIESYVNQICNDHPEVRQQLLINIKNFYWNTINDYMPKGIESPIDQDEFYRIIDAMGAPETEGGNIGWFFSQGTTKAGGAGLYGEIAAMIYLAILCPNLKNNYKAVWAGGTQSDSNVKPPADVILNSALGGTQYGVQVKNYTTGTTLSHEYNIKLREMAEDMSDNSVNEDFMIKQVTSELGITSDEVEAVQNIIISNSFNVPYIKKNNIFEYAPNVPRGFDTALNNLKSTYIKATKYMAIISVIMHRLQYQEEVNRWVTNDKFELNQVQNTLWLINGKMFVSSVQILQELIEYVKNEMTTMFSVNASVSLSKKNDKEILPDELKEGRFTIVEYFNYSADKLRQTALSHVSAKITTNYKMSAFNP